MRKRGKKVATRIEERRNVRKKKEKDKMAESAASPGSVQVAANSPQQQQQQSQPQQQTQQNQQPPDISSSQLASPPITGTGTNRKRSRSSGRDIFKIYGHLNLNCFYSILMEEAYRFFHSLDGRSSPYRYKIISKNILLIDIVY